MKIEEEEMEATKGIRISVLQMWKTPTQQADCPFLNKINTKKKKKVICACRMRSVKAKARKTPMKKKNPLVALCLYPMR